MLDSDLRCSVLYEDADLLVLHKPAGIPSARLTHGEPGTAVEAALGRCPAIADAARTPRARATEPGLLHRLDTGTSGCLAFAKSQAELERLTALWKSPQVIKTYRALSLKGTKVAPREPKPHEVADWGRERLPKTIDFAIGHDVKSAKRMVALLPSHRESRIRGKPLSALTRVIAAHPLRQPEQAHAWDLTIRIETGVMHQIRCHLAALGWPILGDPVYRGAQAERLWLHAWRLELPLKSGTRLRVEASLPNGWKDPSKLTELP